MLTAKGLVALCQLLVHAVAASSVKLKMFESQEEGQL